MKVVLIFVVISVNLFQNIDAKLHRVMLKDEVLPYIDKSIPFITDFFSLENLILEQIDDDTVEIGGFVEAKKSMDRNLPLVTNIRTQMFQKGTWNEGPFRMVLLDMCQEFTNPQRFWYNVSRLITLDICPAQIGDKWEIVPGPFNIIQDIPPTLPIVPWRIYVLVTQGLPGFEKFKYGYGAQLQFLPV